MKKIKTIIILACLGLMLSLPTLAIAANDWGVSGGVDSDGNWGINLGVGNSGGYGSGGSYGLPGGSIFGIVQNILYWLLGILSLVSLIGFIIAGIWYLTAAGDESQIERAKRAMMYSIVGVIVGLSGFVIFQAAQYMLSGQSF